MKASGQAPLTGADRRMTERNPRPRRSFIFTPGLQPDLYPKALASGADIVCVELEDGIAPKDKADARSMTLALFDQPQANDGVERIVRINSIRERFGIEDVQALLTGGSPPTALMIPKIRRNRVHCASTAIPTC